MESECPSLVNTLERAVSQGIFLSKYRTFITGVCYPWVKKPQALLVLGVDVIIGLVGRDRIHAIRAFLINIHPQFQLSALISNNIRPTYKQNKIDFTAKTRLKCNQIREYKHQTNNPCEDLPQQTAQHIESAQQLQFAFLVFFLSFLFLVGKF